MNTCFCVVILYKTTPELQSGQLDGSQRCPLNCTCTVCRWSMYSTCIPSLYAACMDMLLMATCNRAGSS